MNNKLVYGNSSSFERQDMSLWEKLKSIFLRWFYKPSPPPPPLAIDYQKPYVQHLLNCHREVKGFFVAAGAAPLLDDVFVEPQLLPLASISAESPPWADYSSQNRAPHASRSSVWEWVEQSRALWIIGLPGSGKTSLLSQMTLTLGKRFAEEEHSSNQLPIMLFLRDHSQEIHKNPTYTLAEAAQEASIISQMSDPPPANWFSEQLKKGQCVLMMDGLDEVPHAQLHGVATWIEQQIKAYRHNRFVITSRPADRQLLRGVTVLEVQPFTQEQVQRFVEGWYLAHQDEHVASSAAQENAQALINLIGISQPAQKEVTSNPLLLTMIATCQDHLQSLDAQASDHISGLLLSQSRADLYAKVCDLLLDRGGAEFDLTAAQKLRLLQPLAIEMMKHKRGFVSPDEARQVLYVPLDMVSRNPNVAEFLQMIENQGLLCQEDGEYRFAQRTFQEYIAACHIQEQGLERELVKGSSIQDSWWHETIRFYCAGADASPIIAACLRHEKESFSILRLAIDCASGEVEPEMQHRLEKSLKEQIEAWRPDSMQYRVVSQGLLSLRLKSLIAVDETLYVSDSLITNAEYQLFLNETGASQEAIPAHWSQAAYAPLEAVAGIRPSDALAFCEWLTARDREGRSYRLPTIGEFKPLLSETAYWAREARGQTIKLENSATTQISLSALESRLCSALARDLAENGDLARERALAFAQELEKVLHPADALAKACEFTYDGAHYGTMNPSSLDAKPSHSNRQKQASDYRVFEHTRMAKFVTERLLRVLRQEGTAPNTAPTPNPSPNTAPTPSPSPNTRGGKSFGSPPLVLGVGAVSGTLAEQYFKLYSDLQHLQKSSADQSPASGGIRVVASRPAGHRTTNTPHNTSASSVHRRSNRAEAKPRSSSKKQRRQARTHAPASGQALKPTAQPLIQKKICVLGDAGVGKTSLLQRFVEGRFDERYLSTIGVNILRKTLTRSTCRMNMLLWEVEGGYGFKKGHLAYLQGVTGAIIVCDLTRHKTLAALERYVEQLRALNPAAFLVIVGNKVDLLEKRAITDRELNALCKKLGCPYLLTSAKTGTQVNDAFSLLADQIEGARG